MREVIPYYPVDTKFKLQVSKTEFKIVSRLFDSSKNNDQCSQCFFGEPIIETSFSGQRTIKGHCCHLTVTGETNCNHREDGNRIVYKRLVKKQ